MTSKTKTGKGIREEKGARFERFLKEEVWPRLAEEHRGRMPTQEEQDEILGYGPHGV